MTGEFAVVAERPTPPELRPSGIHRAVQQRKKNNDLATLVLAAFVALVVAAALYVVLG